MGRKSKLADAIMALEKYKEDEEVSQPYSQ